MRDYPFANFNGIHKFVLQNFAEYVYYGSSPGGGGGSGGGSGSFSGPAGGGGGGNLSGANTQGIG